jgi:hypothetical protein
MKTPNRNEPVGERRTAADRTATDRHEGIAVLTQRELDMVAAAGGRGGISGEFRK